MPFRANLLVFRHTVSINKNEKRWVNAHLPNPYFAISQILFPSGLGSLPSTVQLADF